MKRLVITEEERREIIKMHSGNLKTEHFSYGTQILNQLNEFLEQLNFQKKVHLASISLLNGVQKVDYLINISEKHVKNLFLDNGIILERYNNTFSKSLILESVVDFSYELDRMNNFIFNSLLLDIGVINEQESFWDKAKNKFSQATQTIKKGVNWVKDKLSKSLNYIKEKGVGFIFENLRKALMSGVGTAIQLALSFTGAGVIVNEVAWGLMTVYDAYQYFVNNAVGSLTNLIIDIICLMTAGSLGKVLSKFVNFAGKSVGQILQKFLNSGLGKYLKPVVSVMSSGASKFSGWMAQVQKFALEKMGLKWVSNIVGKVKDFFVNLSKTIGNVIGKTATKGTGAIIKRGGRSIPISEIGTKFQPAVFRKLSSMTQDEVTMKYAQTVSQALIKVAEKYAEEYLKHKPVEEGLRLIDAKFGTKMGDLYVAYIQGSKAISSGKKIASKSVKTSDLAADAIRGQNTYTKPIVHSIKAAESLSQIIN